jgi:hypothetical protein
MSLPLKMLPIGGPETSVRNYHYSLPNNPEERGYLLRGGTYCHTHLFNQLFTRV